VSRESGPPRIGKGRHDLAAAKRLNHPDDIAEVGQDGQGARGLTPLPEDSERQMSCLDPEAAYVGALLWLPVDRAGHAADLVQYEDLTDPRLRVLLQLVRDVTADGAAPDPVVVLAHARATGIVSTAHGIKQLAELLAELLADLYAGCPLAGSVGHYAGSVLDGSLRRRCALLADRIGQVAASGALTELVRLVGAEVLEVYELRNRRAAVLAGLGMPVQEAAA